MNWIRWATRVLGYWWLLWQYLHSYSHFRSMVLRNNNGTRVVHAATGLWKRKKCCGRCTFCGCRKIPSGVRVLGPLPRVVFTLLQNDFVLSVYTPTWRPCDTEPKLQKKISLMLRSISCVRQNRHCLLISSYPLLLSPTSPLESSTHLHDIYRTMVPELCA